MTMQFVSYEYTNDVGNWKTDTWINWMNTKFPSANIKRVGHDYTEPENNLYIMFHSGDVYLYPKAGWQYAINLMMALSPGSYFNEKIKPMPDYHKLNNYRVLKYG